jgi:hypothetical protein
MKGGRKPKSELSPDMGAYVRLREDGAYSTAAVRRRIALIAAERKLADSETRALLKGRRLTVFQIGEFVEKHHVSVGWLLGGDLKERLRMARNEVVSLNEPPPPPAFAQSRAVHAVLKTLND